MPFSNVFEKQRLIERVSRVRGNPPVAYAVAIMVVAAAAALRWLVGGEIVAGVPFITFFPAIIIATLLGGLGPGIAALVLSGASAWYFFLPPYFSWILAPNAGFSLVLFTALAALNVAIIVLLEQTLDTVTDREQTVRTLIESAPNGIVVIDDAGTIVQVNAATERLFGYTRLELQGKNIEVLVPNRHNPSHRKAREAFQRRPESRAMGAGRDLSGRRKDGSEFPVEIGLSPIFRNGKRAVLATVIDISERKRAQHQQQVVMSELEHRTQNMFAVVLSVAGSSLQQARSIEEGKKVLNGRLLALSRAHKLLAEAAFEGAPLSEILVQEFAAFTAHAAVDGCDIVVNSTAAQQFAMIVHELATNAVKHGALSVAEGRVSVNGYRASLNGEELFRFVWKESGGPYVSVPTRKGFGSAILLDVAGRFAKSAVLDYAPDGISYELRISMSAIAAQPRSHPEAFATFD